jgi:2-polyprenyl-3-methyl-5-hydroxy-6-metoxy-1,4-benzoquinol methylase
MNLDIVLLASVDVVHNLAVLSLPFPSERFDRIVCQGVLEHVDRRLER